MTAAWTAREVPNIGRDLATKAYMAYQLYTDKSSGGLAIYGAVIRQLQMVDYENTKNSIV